MGYLIRYGFEKKKKSSKWFMTAVCFLIFCYSTAVFSPAKWDAAKDFLIPGDAVITKSAYASFSRQMKAGVPLEEALESFCREILVGAKNLD